jgi:hypothetical protein
MNCLENTWATETCDIFFGVIADYNKNVQM